MSFLCRLSWFPPKIELVILGNALAILVACVPLDFLSLMVIVAKSQRQEVPVDVCAYFRPQTEELGT